MSTTDRVAEAVSEVLGRIGFRLSDTERERLRNVIGAVLDRENRQVVLDAILQEAVELIFADPEYYQTVDLVKMYRERPAPSTPEDEIATRAIREFLIRYLTMTVDDLQREGVIPGTHDVTGEDLLNALLKEMDTRE